MGVGDGVGDPNFLFLSLGLGFQGSSEYVRRAGLTGLYGTTRRTCAKILCESPSLLLLCLDSDPTMPDSFFIVDMMRNK